MPTIIGHIQQRQALHALLQRGRLPNSLLFSGPAGVGKSQVARELASSLLCTTKPSQSNLGGCGHCSACILLARGNHADFMLLDLGSSAAGELDHLRDLLRNLQLRPFYGGSRVVVLNNSDRMSMQGANLLLKTLEEPPLHTYFIIITSSLTSLPSTLLSRCHSWFFDSLPANDLRSVLKLDPSLASTGESLIDLADGSLEQLNQLRSYADAWESLSRSLDQIIHGDTVHAVQLARDLSKSKEELPTIMILLRLKARQEMKKSTDDELQRRWAYLLTNVLTAQRLLSDRHLAAQTVLASLFLMLASPLHSASFTWPARDGTLLSHVAV